MAKNPRRNVIIILVVIVVAAILLGGSLVYFLPLKTPISPPMVEIHFPSQGTEVILGESLAVQSSVRDDAELVTKVELWSVKDDVFTLIDQSTFQEGDHLISISQGWLPSNLGQNQLIVRAFSEGGKHGEAAVALVVVEAQDGSESAEIGPGGLSVPVGGFEEEDPLAEASVEPDLQPIPEMEIVFEPSFLLGQGFFSLIWDRFVPVLDLMDVEIEALGFEVQGTYTGVYCYVALEDYPTERIPASGYFATSDQVNWNIQDYLGGNNAVAIPVLLDQPLDIHLECEGVLGNNQTVSLGQLEATHPPADWNGQTFQAAGMGGEGFTITYRINPVISDLVPPTQLHVAEMNQQSYFHWLWAGTVGDVDGFRIYRDEILVADLPANSLYYPVPQTWLEPLCNNEYAYRVTAYRGSEESAPSNQIYFQGAACDFGNNISKVTYISVCEGAAKKFEVKYMYGFPFGSAKIGVQVYKDGEMLPDFYSAHPSIPFGIGTVVVPVMFQGTEPITSDQIVVTMINNQGQVFYAENLDREITWTPGSVDLSISSVIVDQQQNKLRARIRNNGCAMALPSDLAIIRETDGWRGVLSVPQISARDSVIVSMDTAPGEAFQWAGALSLKADALEDILESDEDNNEYHLGEASVKSIQFYKIHVHDDHDALSKGEWNLYFDVNRYINGIFEMTHTQAVHETWGGGVHTFDKSIDLDVSDNTSLLITIHGYEDDPIASKYGTMGAVAVYFSPGVSPVPEIEELLTMTYNYAQSFDHLGSWGPGGDFELVSDMGDFTIYFRLILDR